MAYGSPLDGYDLVTYDDWSEGYDWSEDLVLHKDGKFFTAHDGGCSCNYPWEYGVNLEPQPSLAVALNGFSPQAKEIALKWKAGA